MHVRHDVRTTRMIYTYGAYVHKREGEMPEGDERIEEEGADDMIDYPY